MFGGGFNVNVQLPNILPQVHISSSVYLSSGMCISLRSHHGKYLRADSNLSVNQAPHCQEWERWHVEQHGNHIALRSHHGKYLRADSNKTVNQAPHCQEWERWHIEYKGNQVTLRSHHHTYLRADSNGSVNLTHDCREWEHWTVEVHGGNTSYQQPQYQQQQYQQPQYQQPQYQQPQYQQQYQQPQYGQQMPGMPGMNDQYPSTQYQMPGMNTQYTPQYESPQSLIGRRFFLQSQLGPVAHVHGGNAHNGAKITLWDKNTHGHQSNLHWTLSYAQNGAFYIESCVDQNFVLHQHGATHDNGGEITLWDKRTHGHQGNVQVNFQNVGGEWWIIKFVHSGKCVHVHGGATANGTPCTQWDYVDQSNLKWKFVPL